MEGNLIVFDKVFPGDKVVSRGELVPAGLSPQTEYTVKETILHTSWDHEGHDPFGKAVLSHPFNCAGCGNLVDSQFIILEGREGRFSSVHFQLQRTVISFQTLDVVAQHLKRKAALRAPSGSRGY